MRAVLHGFCEPLSCHTHSTGLGSMFAQLACSIALRPWHMNTADTFVCIFWYKQD